MKKLFKGLTSYVMKKLASLLTINGLVPTYGFKYSFQPFILTLHLNSMGGRVPPVPPTI